MERAKLGDRDHPQYLPSEVLVHRIRATRDTKSDEQFNGLYSVLRNRIFRSCPSVRTQRDGRAGEIGQLLDVREDVFERFVTLLVKDRDKYEDKLDFFEIRFDRAVMLLRKSAFRKVESRDEPLNPLEYDDSGEVSKEVEEHLSLLDPRPMTPEEEFTYRFQVRLAIDSLPEMERRVIEMLEAKVPIESSNPDEPSIARVLGCTPKTVRNRRARAIRRIRETLDLETYDAD